MWNFLKRKFYMDDFQRTNKYDSILGVIFDPNSYEMDKKEMLNQIWKTYYLFFTTKVNGGKYATNARRKCTRQH